MPTPSFQRPKRKVRRSLPTQNMLYHTIGYFAAIFLLCTIILAAACIFLALVIHIGQALYTNNQPPAFESDFLESSVSVSGTDDAIQRESITNNTSEAIFVKPYADVQANAEGALLLDVPYISQEGYPTGCESVSAVMLMNYYGIDIDVDSFIDLYLEKGEFYIGADGQTYAPDPNKAFVGDPHSYYSYGCYAPVIKNAMEQCLTDDWTIINETGQSLDILCDTYINNGHPLLIWATMDMVATSEGTEWIIPENGETFTWLFNEHCLVLVGYDDRYYYFNDPLQNTIPIAYNKTLVETRYEEMGMQALALLP